MQFLAHARRGPSTTLALWMCRRCLLSTQVQVESTQATPVSPRKPKRALRRNEIFFVSSPITPESREIVKSLQGQVPLDKGLAIYHNLKQTNKLHWSLYSTYIPFLIYHQRLDDALQAMREALMQSMIHPHLYNLFLRLLYTKGHHEMALNFLKEVGYTPYEANVETWMTTLMDSPNPDCFAKAMELADFLNKSTNTPMITAYSTIFKRQLENRTPSTANCLQILRIFKEQNQLIPEQFSLPLLVHLLKNPNLSHLHQLVELDSTDLFLRAVDWYNLKTGKDVILQIFYTITNHFPNLAHDFFLTLGPETFSYLWRDFAAILKLKFDLKTKELKLEECDSCLLSALATQPQFGEVLLARMVAKSVTVDPIYFEFQIETNPPPADNPEAVFAWYCRAISKYGVRPSRVMSNAVIYAFLLAGKFDRAREIFYWMKGERLDINGIHLNFARFHLHNKEPEKAMDALVKETIQDGVKPTMADCDKLVDLLGKGGYLKAATNMCMYMHGLNMRPTITTQFYMMKNILKHEGLDDAFILLDRIYQWKMTPDKPMYELLLRQSIKEKRWEKLDEIRQLMRRDRMFFDLHFHNIFLDGYLQMGNEEEAVNILQRISAVGYSPNEETYRILLQHHTAGKNISKIHWLYNKIMDHPAQFVPSLKADLAKAFLAIKQLDRGFRMARELAVLKFTEIGRDLFDVMCYTACYDQQFALVQKFLLELREENFLPSPSVIDMVMDRMAQAKFDFSKLAAAFGVPASSLATSLPPSLTLTHTPPLTPSPSVTLSTPSTPPIPTLCPSPALPPSVPSLHPFVDLFPSSPDATPLTTTTTSPITTSPIPTSPIPTSPTSPITTSPISPFSSPTPPAPLLTTSPASPISPPTSPLTTSTTFPSTPTSSTLSPSSAPSSTLSRDVAFEFRDTYAELRPAHAAQVARRAEFESRQKLGFLRYYFGQREEEEQTPADPFKEYSYVYEKREEERGKESRREGEEREGEGEREGEREKQKRDSKLRAMFLSLRLW